MLSSKNKILPLPGALVISTYAPCPDIRSVVTPDLKCPPSRPASSLLWVSLAPGMYRVGGSALSQVCMCVVFYECLSSHIRHIYIGARRCLVQSTVPKPVKVITDVSHFHRHPSHFHRHPINEDQKHQQSETGLWMFIMRATPASMSITCRTPDTRTKQEMSPIFGQRQYQTGRHLKKKKKKYSICKHQTLQTILSSENNL